MSRIFLSHSSKDAFEAVAVRDWLASRGWDDVFLDLDPARGIAAGERWERALHKAATRCEAVIFLVSRNWLGSGWCRKEFALARGLNKQLFAAIVDPGQAIAELPPELNGTWQVVDLTAGQDIKLMPVRLPGAHAEKHIGFARDGLRRLKRGLEKAGLDPKFFAWPPAGDPDRLPFRGLKPLDGVDAGIFFGRDAPIVEAADRLRGLCAGASPRLLVILGASGAGKSSFLRAGLLPRLARDDSRFLPLPVIRPERAALFGESGFLAALETALPGRTRAELRAAIRAGAAALRPLLAELADASFQRTLAGAETAKPPAVVIAIDQAEELFRADGAGEGAALLGLIRDLTVEDRPAVIAIFAIRSDSYDALEHARPFEGLPQHTLPLLPMPRGAYKDVIEGPAHRFVEGGGRLAVEPQLTHRLLEDLDKGGGSDALPLLAFTLEQLFLEFGRAGALRLADYEAYGGLKGAIDAAVERAFARADFDPRIPRDRAAREALLRRGLIPWLAGIDPETKSPRRNIARRLDIPDEAGPLIDLLVEERLLSTDSVATTDATTGVESRAVTIEPAHEALLRQWGLLQGWLAADFGLLATLEGVKRSARDWDANGRPDAWLAHQGQRLADAQGLDARPDIAARLDAIDRAYVAGSRAKEESARAAEEARRREREQEQARRLADAQALALANRRTARRTGAGLVAALVLAVAAGAFGLVALSEKKLAARQALEAQTQRDAAEAAKAEAQAQKAAAELASREARVQRDRAEGALGEAKTQRDAAQDAKTEAQAQRDAAEAAKKEAQAQSLRAERALGQATQTANVLVFDLARKFRTATGVPTATIKAILDPALKLQDDLIGAGETDPQLLYSQSAALSEAAVTFLTLGDTQNALADALKAHAIMADLVKSQPDNTLWQRDLAVSLEKIGNIKLRQGDLAGALATFADSLAIDRRLAKDADAAGARRNLALLLQSIGDAKAQAGDQAGALASQQESLGLVRGLAKDTSDTEAQRDLAVGLNELGDAKLQAGDMAGALAAYDESLGIVRALAKDAGSALAQRDLFVGLEKIGDVKVQAGDQAGALAAYDEALGIAHRLAADKTNAQAQRDVLSSLQSVGDVRLDGGDQAGALAAFEEAVAIARALAKDASNASAQRDLGVSLSRLGNAKLQARDLDGALAAYEESLGIARALAKDTDNAQAQRDLSIDLEKLGDVKLQGGDKAGALAAYEEDLAIARALAGDKDNADAQRDLSISLERTGDVKLQQGDRAGALADYRESLGLRRALAKDASNARARTDLVLSLMRVALLSAKPDQLYREALALLTELDEQGRLAKNQQGWIDVVKRKLAGLSAKAQ